MWRVGVKKLVINKQRPDNLWRVTTTNGSHVLVCQAVQSNFATLPPVAFRVAFSLKDAHCLFAGSFLLFILNKELYPDGLLLALHRISQEPSSGSHALSISLSLSRRPCQSRVEPPLTRVARDWVIRPRDRYLYESMNSIFWAFVQFRCYESSHSNTRMATSLGQETNDFNILTKRKLRCLRLLCYISFCFGFEHINLK